MPTHTTFKLDPLTMLRPRRRITGMSAILLPFAESGAIDWDGFCRHVARTAEAGLTPAVNMDTGYGNLIDAATRLEALRLTRQTLGKSGAFVAGTFVADRPGDAFDFDSYRSRIDEVHAMNGVPVVTQSFGLSAAADIPAVYAKIAEHCPKFIAFELGTMFAPFGRIYDLATYEAIVRLPQCIGAKHSSLSRELEWQRLILRDRVRPEFMVLTGNDLAIDMVMYGSDYLLGLSTFAPDLFAKRDALWASGDPAFYELNDKLQYLGHFAFRDPVPAYKHNAAQFLKLRGWIACDATHPRSAARPDSDVAVLATIGRSMGVVL